MISLKNSSTLLWHFANTLLFYHLLYTVNKIDIEFETRESIADDRSMWRCEKVEEDRLQDFKLKWKMRMAKERINEMLHIVF